jgi:transcriptional regulator with XRE-family HTH domain
MATVQGPTVGRRRLRSALRRAREDAGLTQEQVAAAMDWSLSKLIRIEAGTVSISTNDVKALLNYYRMTDGSRVADLVALARVARRRTWWSQYKDALPVPYLAYIGLEIEASELRFFDSTGIPSLLQTQQYARAAVQAWAATTSHPLGPGELEARTAVQLRRQREILERSHPPTIDVVLDEATLHRQTGGASCLRAQLLHLVALGATPHITVQVLPFASTTYACQPTFVILEFSDDDDTGAVYLDGGLTQELIDRPELVVPYQQTFERLRQMSLPAAESLATIAKIASEVG